MTAWPPYTTLTDITLTPLAHGSGKLNMAFEASEPSSGLQHLRYDGSIKTIDILPLRERVDAEEIAEPVLYAGPLFRHFGHALSESIHRLWPRLVYSELNGIKVAFHPVNGVKLLPYLVEALNLHGISAKQVIRIDRPMRFSKLIVAPQARLMAGPTINRDYPALLDGSLAKRIPSAGEGRRIYVSRSKHAHTGSYYGESYIERFLLAAGFEIIWPEDYTVHELVGILRSSSYAVFAEGSAIHALELCGSQTPATFVIGRRKGSVPRFTPLLSSVCNRFMVVDRCLFNDGLSDDPKKHSGFLDIYGVASEIAVFADLADVITPSDIPELIRQDLEAHISDPRAADRICVADSLRRRIASYL